MRHARNWIGLTTLAGGLLLAGIALAQEKPDPQKAALGAGAYRAYCASCHGTAARGDGEVAQYLRVKPSDLSKISANNGGEFPFDQVVAIIDGRKDVPGHGAGEMPVWGDAFLVAAGGSTEEESQAKIRHLAHFLWSIQQ